VILPIAQGVSLEYHSLPDDGSAGRLGTYLMNLLYQCDIIICATFLTGQAANFIIANTVLEKTGIQLTYTAWLAAAIVPSMISLLAVPLLVYRFFPPEVKETPEAPTFAAAELQKVGPMSRNEKIMLLSVVVIVALWITKDWHGIDTGIVALGGICFLLAACVLDWSDLMGEQNAWSVFIWYGGLVNMAAALGETKITTVFAEHMATLTGGMSWEAALAILLLIYFYTHYFFASITAHVLAMLIPFLAATIAVGAPVGLAVLALAFCSNLNASLTHYGTTPAPVYFGTGYVRQGTWWTVGFAASIVNIAVWSTAGPLWWKLLGWW
jgi:DASS family divalent anion:Na+ symporter